MPNTKEAKPMPRRSFLGRRAKLFSTNSNNEEPAHSAPLYSSSPVEKDNLDGYNTGTNGWPGLKKSCSSPSLVHPFEANDSNASLFFVNGHSESEWSVFKPNKKVERIRVSRPSVSRKLINDTLLGIREEKEEHKSKYNSNRGIAKTLEGPLSEALKKGEKSIEQKLKLEWLAYDLKNSTDDLSENTLKDDLVESRIGKGIKDKGELKCESNWGNTKTLDLHHSDRIKKRISDENNLPSMNECDESKNLTYIFGLLEKLKADKEEMDAKLMSLSQQKEEFDKTWDMVTSALSRYSDNFSESQDNNLTNVKSVKQTLNRKCDDKIINNFSNKCTISSQHVDEMKENINYIKTPVVSNRKLKHLRKSICYTPNSLSAVVGVQASDIFDDI